MFKIDFEKLKTFLKLFMFKVDKFNNKKIINF